MHRVIASLVLLIIVSGCASKQKGDPLPNWNDGASKKAIVDFVTKTTTEGSPGYVKPADRIAVFDNDGTLWAEQPIYFQFAFAIDRLRAMAPQHPEWQNSQLHKELLTGDLQVIAKTGDVYQVSWITNGKVQAIGVGMEVENGLAVGWRRVAD